METPEPHRHAVVFDCNVYLDIADLLGPPFSWDKLAEQAARVVADPLPHTRRAVDSLRAIAVCESGMFAGSETLEVWTNSHIDVTVRYKAMESSEPDPVTGYRGLGWRESDAQGLVSDLIGRITSISSGGTLGNTWPEGNPPLDHEDGMVFGACRHLSSEDPVCQVYCVTRDRGFRDHFKDGHLGSCARVLSPSQFVALVRKARAAMAIHRMRPT